MAVTTAPGGVFVLLVAVRQRLHVALFQPVEHRVGVGIVDPFADLVVHHVLEREMLGRRRATEQQQKNGGCPYSWRNRDYPYIALACTTSACPAHLNGSEPPSSASAAAILSITSSTLTPRFSISAPRGVPRTWPVA